MTAANANLRSAPGTSSRVVATLVRGAKLECFVDVIDRAFAEAHKPESKALLAGFSSDGVIVSTRPPWT